MKHWPVVLLCAWVLMRPYVPAPGETGWGKLLSVVWYWNTWEIVQAYETERDCRVRAARVVNEGMEATGRKPLDPAWLDFHLALLKATCVPAELADRLGVSIRPSPVVMQR